MPLSRLLIRQINTVKYCEVGAPSFRFFLAKGWESTKPTLHKS